MNENTAWVCTIAILALFTGVWFHDCNQTGAVVGVECVKAKKLWINSNCVERP